MNKAYEQVAFLAEHGRHIKLDRWLRDLSYADMIEHAHKELSELQDALKDGPDNGAIFELADLLCIAMHVAIRNGWSLTEIQSAMLYKLDSRFDTPELQP